MGNDYRTQPVDPSWIVHEQRHDHEGGRRQPPPHAYEQARPPAHPSAEDAASVAGVPADRVTPEILAAITPLMTEIERLRGGAEQAAHRISWLEQQGDRHPVVPCLSRRAILRELEKFLGRGEEMDAILAVIQVGGFEDMRTRHGLAAAEAGLRQVAACIIAALRAADLAGCLGFSDFAVVMPATDVAQADNILFGIRQQIEATTLTWDGEDIHLQVWYGIHRLSSGEDGERALAEADRARHALSSADQIRR